MTIARKLWLGFGLLILIFLLAGLIIFLSQRSIQSILDHFAGVDEPTRAAAYEMEINATEIGRSVLEYVNTGDPRYRERFAQDRADFERYPFEVNGIEAVRNDELRIFPTVRSEGETQSVDVEPLSYSWEGWDVPIYHERKKKSYEILREAFGDYDEVRDPPR